MFHHSTQSAENTVYSSRCKNIPAFFISQVQVLRNAGEEVTLTVSFLKKTPAFLKLPLCEDCTCKKALQTLLN